MDLALISNAPRLLLLQEEPFFVGRPTPRGLGMLLEEAHSSAPEAEIYSPEYWRVLDNPNGRVVVIYVALYRHQPGLTLMTCLRLASTITDEEYSALLDLYFRKDPAEKAQSKSQPDIRSWGERLDGVRRYLELSTYEEILDLSFDQITALGNEGCAAHEIITEEQKADIWRKAEEAIKARKEAEAAGLPPAPLSPEAQAQMDVAKKIAEFQARQAEADRLAYELSPQGREDRAIQEAAERLDAANRETQARQEVERLMAEGQVPNGETPE